MENELKAHYLFEINKSKFYGYIYKVSSINEVETLLSELKKLHKKSKHICYAYQIKINEQMHVKYSDDGEPKGSAGLPILFILEKNNITDHVVFIVRYFGGSKLGVTNLYRSYMKTAQETIKQM